MDMFDLFERAPQRQFSDAVEDYRTDPRIDEKTHIVLTKSGAILYRYGEDGTVPWRETYDKCRKVMDTSLQQDPMGIRYTQGGGILIGKDRDNGTWTGDRTRYSTDIRPIVERLLELGLAGARTPILIGNWARRDDSQSTLIGTAALIMRSATTPNTLVLYHGTSNTRAKIIEEHGLQPMDVAARVWDKDKKEVMPEHRAESIYLTASIDQANYYAKKAVNIDRKRLTWSHRMNLQSNIRLLQIEFSQNKENIELYSKPMEDMSAEGEKRRLSLLANAQKQTKVISDKLAKLSKGKELLDRMNNTVEKVEPVIFEITLSRRNYRYLLADDDYLQKMKHLARKVDVSDWRESLSDFGQVAYRGSIPADQIKRL